MIYLSAKANFLRYARTEDVDRFSNLEAQRSHGTPPIKEASAYSQITDYVISNIRVRVGVPGRGGGRWLPLAEAEKHFTIGARSGGKKLKSYTGIVSCQNATSLEQHHFMMRARTAHGTSI